jgi:hypothetical protein
MKLKMKLWRMNRFYEYWNCEMKLKIQKWENIYGHSPKNWMMLILN